MMAILLHNGAIISGRPHQTPGGIGIAHGLRVGGPPLVVRQHSFLAANPVNREAQPCDANGSTVPPFRTPSGLPADVRQDVGERPSDAG